MPVKNLTARAVQGLKPVDGKRVDYFDDSLKGFFVRVTESGVKSAGVLYKRSGRLVRFTIGQLPPLTLADAREKGKDILAQARLGSDPQGAKKADRNAGDFAVLVARYIDAREPDLAAATAYEYRRIARAYLGPLGRLSLSALKGADIDACLGSVAKKNGPVMANRAYQLLLSVCRWGRRKGALAVNPIETVDRPRKERTRKRVLADAELRFLAAALEEAKPSVRGLATALVLLGQRYLETAKMRWRDLDLEADVPVWVIPGEFRKGGRPHTVPLAPQAVTLLREFRPFAGERERVFHGAGAVHPGRWWNAVRERTIALAKAEDLAVEHFVIHDLRRTCRTGLSAFATPDVAERVIGHVLQGVREIYDRHSYLKEKYAALCAWARHVEAVVSGAARGARVVTMRGRA
jgi:integrase